MLSEDGLICAYILDGKGGGREADWAQSKAALREGQTIWLHLDRKSAETRRWLVEESGLSALACEALLAEETRPRSVMVDEGLIAILRGVNLNAGADPEDMVSVRVWVDSGRVITMRSSRLMAIQDIREALSTGRGPESPGEFLVQLASRLLDRMGPVLEGLDGEVDRLEEQVVVAQSHELRTQLGGVRRQAIQLRRYMAPQRDVLIRLSVERLPWLTDLERARLREAADRLTRYVEDLDASRERAAVTQEELAGRLSEQMNRTMYVLSLVAAVFLPLGLLTGLLGINVGGIPGTENPWAFAFVCVVLIVLAAVGVWLFRRLRLF